MSAALDDAGELFAHGRESLEIGKEHGGAVERACFSASFLHELGGHLLGQDIVQQVIAAFLLPFNGTLRLAGIP
jgi:hypothetical protein